MSLLLDALKKAADDKAKASRGHSSGLHVEEPVEQTPERPHEPPRENLDQQSAEAVSTEGLSLEPASVVEDEVLSLDAETATGDELTLEDSEPGIDQVSHKTESAEPVAMARGKNKRAENKRTDASKFTVSDAALSLLIDKTNRDVKRNKKIFIASVITISLVILLSGGMYYYTDMQAEIADIERKHQIAMQSMRLKTSREKTPDKSAIIRNLVSDAELEEKVKYAKAQMVSEKNSVSTRPKVQARTEKKAATADLTIKRTNKADPVGEKLDAAWLAYDNGNYDEAKRLYKDTLRIEGSNRDAQLGLGAIAVIEKDDTRAKKIYQSLLQQDPRDPIAIAALTAMSSNDESSLKSNNDYLLSLLEKNPDTPHLNFSVANNFAQQNRWKSAQQYYFKAWQLDNQNADYIFNLAVSMDQLGKPAQAVNFYQDSLNKSMNKQVSFSREAAQKRINELSGL